MAIRQNKDGSWTVDVTFGTAWDGSRDRRRVKCATKKEAVAEERRLLVLKECLHGTSGRIRLRDFVEQVYWPQKRGLRANTVRGYERDLRLRILPMLGDTYVEDIGKLQIQAMINACPTRKTATNARETLSSVLRVAVELGLLPANPAGFRYTYPPAGEPREWGEWLTSFSEHRRYLEHLAEHHGGEAVERIAVLGLCFGLRKGEVLGMDFERVDLVAGSLSVMQTYVIAKGGPFLAPPKTEKAKRTVPMLAYARERISAWGRPRRTSEDLFGKQCHPVVFGRDGSRLSPATAENLVRGLRSESFADGTPLPAMTAFSMRHSFATACIRQGIDVSTVSAWLGHRDVSTTYNRYVKPLLVDMRADAMLIDEAYGMSELAVQGRKWSQS